MWILNCNFVTRCAGSRYATPIRKTDWITSSRLCNVAVDVGGSTLESVYCLKFIIEKYGCIEDWDVSIMTTMDYLFDGTYPLPSMDPGIALTEFFAYDISKWNTKNVVSMKGMFKGAAGFNTTLNWNTTKVANMESMFQDATSFRGDGLSTWDLSLLTNTKQMFYGASVFNQDLNSWSPSLTSAAGFKNFEFASWQNVWVLYRFLFFDFFLKFSILWICKIRDRKLLSSQIVWITRGMFKDAKLFHGNVRNFDMSAITDFSEIFMNAARFNKDLSSWDVRKATTLKSLFHGAACFNQNLSSWDIQSVSTAAGFQKILHGATSFGWVLCSHWLTLVDIVEVAIDWRTLATAYIEDACDRRKAATNCTTAPPGF